MTINPMIPVWLMAIFCVALLLFKRKGVLPYVRQIIAVVLLFCINLRIMVPDENQITDPPKVDAYVLFVIDDTISMIAEDGHGETGTTRLDAVREDCDYIMEELYGARFGIMTFHNNCQVVCPYTENAQHISSMLKTIEPLRMSYAEGSSFNLCQEMMKEQLDVANSKEDANVYVFFISDGENNKDEDIESYKDIKKLVDGGAVLGYGTKKGAGMLIKPYEFFDNYEYLEDSKGEKAISKLDEENLKTIAEDMDLDYIHMKETEDIDPVIDNILEDVRMTQEAHKELQYNETYYYFLIPLILILIWDFIDFKRKVWHV